MLIVNGGDFFGEITKPIGQFLGAGVVVAASVKFASDGAPCTRFHSGARSVTPEVVQKRWADDDILLFENEFEILSVSDDASRSDRLGVVDVGHDGEVNMLLEFERSRSGIEFPAFG